MYFDDTDHPTHLGVVVLLEPEIVLESAWGDFEKVFRHKIMDVPSRYGDKVKFFLPLAFAQVKLISKNLASLQKFLETVMLINGSKKKLKNLKNRRLQYYKL